jgi:hypothetical protein
VHEELNEGIAMISAMAGEPAAKSAPTPKLHQILQQMNGGKRFCFDFRGAQLLLSVSLGRSNRKKWLKSIVGGVEKHIDFFNQGRSRPGQIG